ncbi:sulfite exporter TauE/SafE family protein [Kordiimonas sp.]|uniref:sulfite exporter TauE/SafE family protein n=1 Tax=Kordiimonas sp. TaxID=1970157 RepID=UPI003A8D5F48
METILSGIGGWAIFGMAAAIMVAAALRSFTGFGFALAALPVLSLFLAPTTAASMIVMLTLVISVQTFQSYRRDIPYRSMGPMIVLSALGTVGGTYLLLLFSPDTFRLLIGVTVMTACLLLAKFKPAPHREGGITGAGAGLASGLMNGALAIPGPPVIIYSMAVFEDPRVGRAFLMGFFLLSASFATVTYSLEGIITSRELLLTAIAFPAMLIGDKTGAWLFEKHGSAAYRKVAIAALFAIGMSVAAAALLP